MNRKFNEWIEFITKKYQKSQTMASYCVNYELISFYYVLGKEISETEFKKEYGSKFYEKVSNKIKEKLPQSKGLSIENIRYAEKFYSMYSEISPQLVEKLFLVPWGHHRIIIDKIKKDISKALFYIEKTIDNHWSRKMLVNFINCSLYENEGKGLTNFINTIDGKISELAKLMIKDKYYFDFLCLNEKYSEHQFKNELVLNVRNLMLELGKGFAFVAQEYCLLVENNEFYIDLLFYNIILHSYVVVEIKITKFKPEHLGQLSFYVSAINHSLKGEMDNATIGLLICREKDDLIVKYSLENLNVPLGVSSYVINNVLPSSDEIKVKLKGDSKNNKEDDFSR